jgi:uncharacterized protein YfaA (DUF2138 family)
MDAKLEKKEHRLPDLRSLAAVPQVAMASAGCNGFRMLQWLPLIRK